MGARATGMGYASACLFDEWSLFNNPSGLTKIEKPIAAASYDCPTALPGAHRIAGVLALPTKYGVTGIGVLRFGDDLYNEHIVSAGFSDAIGTTSIGGKVNYIQYSAEGFGTKGVVSLTLGGIIELTHQITIGVHIINLNQPVIAAADKEHLPTVLVAGVGFSLTEKLYVATEIEQDLEYEALWKGGLEYKPFDKFSFRTGFNLHPDALFLGTGFYTRKLQIHYAIQHSPVLGLSFQATVGYQLQDRS